MRHAPRKRGPAASIAAWNALAITTTVLLAVTARAVPVDCDSPNDFCTGDPCITSHEIEITVASCLLDFRPRALVIADVVLIPNNGNLSLSAGSIDVQRRLDGKHTKESAGDGATISLVATGDITIQRRVDATGRNSPGSILLDAGGTVELQDQLRAAVRGRTALAPGGAITVLAGQTITSTASAKVDARGKLDLTPGGQVILSGQGGVGLKGKVDLRGNPGGTAIIGSFSGDVTLQRELRGEGHPGQGGTFTLFSGGDFTVEDRIVASGGPGGFIEMNVGGTLDAHWLRARGLFGLAGGTVAAFADTVLADRIETRGSSTGGLIAVTSTAGHVTVEDLDAAASNASGTGGTITVHSANDLLVADEVDVSGEVGGETRFTSVGDMVVGVNASRDFDARGTLGGTIEGKAGGNLTARGDFEAATGGCIGLSAGGMLDTTDADFDVPLTASCP
jgi:hypothetical protein